MMQKTEGTKSEQKIRKENPVKGYAPVPQGKA